MNSCVVTGAAAGIGRAIADRLLRDGWAVIGVDVDSEGLGSLVAQAESRTAVAVVGDVADPATLKRAGDAAEAHGSIRGWVNNAAIYFPGSAHDLDEGDVRRQLDVNLVAVMFGSSEAVQRLLPQGGGAILSVSSIQAIAAFPRSLAYAAAKGGINAITRQMAVEYAPFGIRVNAVMPGAIRTPMSVDGWRSSGDLAGAERADALLHPLRRLGEPADVASLVSFLLSDDASFITGQTIAVDGGASARVIVYEPDQELALRFPIQGTPA